MPPLITLQDSFTLSICNRTDQHVFASSAHSTGEKETYPARSTRDSPLHLTTSQKSLLVNLFNKRDELLCELDLLVVPLGNATSKWKSIYTFNHSSIRLLHRIIPQSIVQLLILPQRDCATFLSSLDDATCLTSFCLPGTHDSLSLYGWPISSCQASDSSVTKQLNDGIRYLDVRLAPKGLPGKERLLAYHGITDQRIEFGKVLDECFDFLNGVGRHETIIMSLKQESGLQDTFIKLLFTKYVDQSPATPDGILASGRHRWFLEDRVPRLGEARGKIVMLSRFVIHPSYNLPGGISPPIWPNDLKEPFEYRLRSSRQKVQTQDWYGIGTLSAIPEKMSLIKRLCQESGSEDDAFTLNYCNGCSFPFALPPAVAKGFLDDGTKTQEERYALTNMMATQGVNSHLRDYVVDLLHKAPRSSRQGAIDGLKVTWALDFYNEPKGAADLVRLLIEANF